MEHKFGFTLAEVLITIGIIGVVAAITIPALIANNKAIRLRSQFLKSYSTIQQAFRLMEEDDVSTDPSSYPTRTYYKTFMKYLKGATDCGYSGKDKSLQCANVTNQESNNYKAYDRTTHFRTTLFDDGEIAMPDGSLIFFENDMYPGHQYIYVSVDLNGYTNPPNIAGYDVFTFQLIDGELKPMGSKGTNYANMNLYCNPSSTDRHNGIACAVKAKDNSDYFKKIVKEFK